MKKDWFDKMMDLTTSAAIVAIAVCLVWFVFKYLPQMIEIF